MRFLIHLYLLIFLACTVVFAGDEVDLFRVAREGNAAQMRGLITSGADLSGKDVSGRNVLMQAVIFGNRATALVLLENA